MYCWTRLARPLPLSSLLPGALWAHLPGITAGCASLPGVWTSDYILSSFRAETLHLYLLGVSPPQCLAPQMFGDWRREGVREGRRKGLSIPFHHCPWHAGNHKQEQIAFWQHEVIDPYTTLFCLIGHLIRRFLFCRELLFGWSHRTWFGFQLGCLLFLWLSYKLLLLWGS